MRGERSHVERVGDAERVTVENLAALERGGWSPGRRLGKEPQRPALVSLLPVLAREVEGPIREPLGLVAPVTITT